MALPAERFDRRIVPDKAIELVLACQRLVPCRFALAIRKDGGVDPGVLAWLLDELPVSPMPRLLLPLSLEELTEFRTVLKERMRIAAVPR